MKNGQLFKKANELSDNAQSVVNDLIEEIENLEDFVEVKQAMIDALQEKIEELKSKLAD